MADTHTIEQDIVSLKAEVKYLATKEDLQVVRTEIEAVRGDLKADIERMGRTLIMWVVSAMIALTGVFAAITKLIK